MSLNKTLIDWVKNPDGTQGYTWNPITGCLNHINGLCKGGGFPCYAYRLAHGRLKERYLANINIAPSFMDINKVCDPDYHQESGYADPFYPRFWPERIPPHTYHKMDWKGVPIGIFVCDMGELFGDWIPHDWQAEIFDVILNNPWHRFYLLTKQPQNLLRFSPFPSNCWVGVTATDPDMFDTAFRALMNIEAKVKYVSFEPLLDWCQTINLDKPLGTLNWVIIGGQTRPTVMPKIEWIEEIVRAADKADIPIFNKNNLFPLFRDEMGYLNTGWLRQEIPK